MQFSSKLPAAVHILLAIVEFEGKKSVHAVLDNRLLAIQEAMKQQMNSITLQNLIDDMNNMLILNA